MLDDSPITFHTKSRLNSIEVYAVIFHYIFIRNRARATFARLCRQGARYFETRKVIFVVKIDKPILFEPIKPIKVNSFNIKPRRVAAYQGIPLKVSIQDRDELADGMISLCCKQTSNLQIQKLDLGLDNIAALISALNTIHHLKTDSWP